MKPVAFRDVTVIGIEQNWFTSLDLRWKWDVSLRCRLNSQLYWFRNEKWLKIFMLMFTSRQTKASRTIMENVSSMSILISQSLVSLMAAVYSPLLFEVLWLNANKNIMTAHPRPCDGINGFSSILCNRIINSITIKVYYTFRSIQCTVINMGLIIGWWTGARCMIYLIAR